MKLIIPTPVTESILTASSVLENDFGYWDPETTFNAGSRCIKNHRIFESVVAENIGHDPLTSAAGIWIDVGPTNRFGMFDEVVGTKTVADTSFSFSLAPGRADSIVFMDLDAATVTVVQKVSGVVVDTRVVSTTDDSGISDWAGYFFDPIIRNDFVAITDMTVLGESTFDITISKNSGQVSCGVCVVGLQEDLGTTKASPSVSINDYSKKTTDDFGNVSLVRRDFSKRQSARLVIENTALDHVFRKLAEVRSTPAVWIGERGYSALLVYGWLRDYEIDIAYATHSYCSINIEGMI